ncbi:iron-sulfur cluster assembly scaffold protein [Cohaesibacter celericrescens]|uniref:Iron-sulfur cluster assembly scaffold protein n=1 Tax=Cohaesibacter celericrescens TaxID=2067669 RepID=A0A2N5XW38_9HYPH|nr:iron-sulfur cluster assembly scaffold protein [Cohaesibacter celericrescens]PLW78714.1 iron-sulfur cluster assembly scaffold protein [Cohaesibacter celericrescens]
MLDAIYNKKILEFAGNIPRLERLVDPQASAKAHSKLCGSTIEVDLVMADGKVTDYGHMLNACALGQAASSVVARLIIGADGDELRQLRDQMQAMLTGDGPPPEGKWSDLKYLEPVRDYPARHESTLLVFKAVVDAVEQIEAAGTGANG